MFFLAKMGLNICGTFRQGKYLSWDFKSPCDHLIGIEYLAGRQTVILVAKGNS